MNESIENPTDLASDELSDEVSSSDVVLPQPPRASRPAVPPPDDALPRGKPRDEILSWATAHGVEKQVGMLIGMVSSLRPMRWDRWMIDHNARMTVLDVLSAIPAAALVRADRVPEAVQRLTWLWLSEEVTRAATLREQDQANERRWARVPKEPALAALWTRVRAARQVLRAEVEPRLPEDRGTPRIRILDDPPILELQDERNDTCDAVRNPQVSVRLRDGEALLTCDCWSKKDGRCPVGLLALDGLLDLLSAPESDPTRRQIYDAATLEPWQHLLRRLDAASLAAHAPSPGPLGWRIKEVYDGTVIEPVLVKVKRRGEGHLLTRVSFRDLSQRPELVDSQIDRQIAAALCPNPDRDGAKRQDPDLARGNQALALLVGHPRVFRENTPIPVKKGALGLHVRALQGGGVELIPTLGNEPTPIGSVLASLHHRKSAGLLTIDRGDAGWLVVPVPPGAEAAFAAFRGKESRFPAEATPALMESLASLGEILQITWDTPLAPEEANADPRPLLRLELGADTALRVEVRVRPNPDGASYPPGEGPQEVLAAGPKGRVRIRRNIDAEPVAVRAAVLPLNLPPEAEILPFFWQIDDPQRGLELLATLRAEPDRYQVLWTSARPRVTRPAAAADLKVGVRSQRDWFGLTGTLKVEDLSLPLWAILEAARSGRRFVSAGDDAWVELSETLIRQLEGPAAVAAGSGKGGVELAPVHAPLVAALAEAGAEVDAPADWMDLTDRIAAAASLEPVVPAALRAELRDYQKAGYQWLARLATWAPGAVLADDMGLGKTVQALALLVERAFLGPALVVAPTSVGFNWGRETERFAPTLRMVSFRGAAQRARLDGLGPGDLVVTSYDLIVRHQEIFESTPWGTIVFDEAHALKNAATQRTRAASALDAPFRVALTGTPVENRTSDLWSLFRIVIPGLLGGWEHFRQRFAAPIERDRDPARRMALARLIRPFVLRRLKKQVASELPPRTEVVLEVELSPEERIRYDATRQLVLTQLSEATPLPTEQRRFQVLAALTRLRQLACHPRLVSDDAPNTSAKLEALRELLEELRDEGQAALVFSQFTRLLGLVRTALEADGYRVRYLDGATPAAQRMAEVDAFQRGEGDVFLLSLKAGGVGLNLTRATYVIHLDPWWNPAVEDQAADRAHRIGQEQPVTIYRIVAQGTLEPQILTMHKEKRALTEALLEGTGEAAALSTEDLLALLRGEAGAEAPETAAAFERAERALAEAPIPPPPPKPEPAAAPPDRSAPGGPDGAPTSPAFAALEESVALDLEEGVFDERRGELLLAAARALLAWTREVDGAEPSSPEGLREAWTRYREEGPGKKLGKRAAELGRDAAGYMADLVEMALDG